MSQGSSNCDADIANHNYRRPPLKLSLRYCCLLTCKLSKLPPAPGELIDCIIHNFKSMMGIVPADCRRRQPSLLCLQVFAPHSAVRLKVVSQLRIWRFFCNGVFLGRIPSGYDACGFLEDSMLVVLDHIKGPSQCVRLRRLRRHRTSTLFSIPRVSPTRVH